MRFKLTIAYDGTRFCGWQVQPNGLSIQSLVQTALQTILRHPIELTGAGRTDAGVHARGQTAHFNTDVSIAPFKLCYAANALLPPDIRILKAETVPDDFHARYSATGKIYHYHFGLGEGMDPTRRLYRTQIFGSFDKVRVKTAAQFFLGTHDFCAFSNHASRGTASYDSIRTLLRLDVIDEPQGLRLEFEGDGFLYKMVRNIAGTLADVAGGRIPPDAIKDILAGKDRRAAGWSAPAQGLFLVEVKY